MSYNSDGDTGDQTSNLSRIAPKNDEKREKSSKSINSDSKKNYKGVVRKKRVQELPDYEKIRLQNIQDQKAKFSKKKIEPPKKKFHKSLSPPLTPKSKESETISSEGASTSEETQVQIPTPSKTPEPKENEDLPDYEKIRNQNIQEQKRMFLEQLKKSAKSLSESMNPKTNNSNSEQRKIMRKVLFKRSSKRLGKKNY